MGRLVNVTHKIAIAVANTQATNVNLSRQNTMQKITFGIIEE